MTEVARLLLGPRAAGRGPLAGAKKRLMILFFTLSLVMNSINRNPEKKMTDKLNKS